MTDKEQPQDTVQDLEKLLEKIEGLEEELEKLRTQLSHQMADSVRIRQIAEREKSQQASKTKKEVAQLLVPVADDLDRALSMLSDISDDSKCKPPVEYILTSLTKAFEQMGLSAVDPLGLAFDPHRFELGGQEPSENEENKVCKVLRKGYTLNGEVIRPALVVCTVKKQEEK